MFINISPINFCFKLDGTVRWRRYPCFCPGCFELDWNSCSNRKMVGEMYIVKVTQ